MPKHTLIGARGMTPRQLLDFHRAHFGDARMEVAEDVGEAPKPRQPSPPREAGPDGFPESTPLAEMSVEQREAYWKHQARKHEGTVKARADYDDLKAELEQLRAATKSSDERARDEQIASARTEAVREVGSKYADALFRSVLAGAGRTPDEIDMLAEPINFAGFAGDDGDFDIDKVLDYAATLAPATGSGHRGPDMGQGSRGVHSAPSGIAAGAELHQRLYGKNTTK